MILKQNYRPINNNFEKHGKVFSLDPMVHSQLHIAYQCQNKEEENVECLRNYSHYK